MTRLVLPIRYCFPAEGSKAPGENDPSKDLAPFDGDQWVYRRREPEDLEDIWRRSVYFTVDTSYALFRRAHWYRLEPASKPDGPAKEVIWNSFRYSAPPFGRAARDITVDISPPMVVLFDAESAGHWSHQDSLFQIGFLYLDFHLSAEKKCAIYLEDLLEVNERARCLWLPYEGYGDNYLRVMAGCRHLWAEGRGSDQEWEEFQKGLLKEMDNKRREFCAARDKEEANKVAAWFDRRCSGLSMWSAAFNYPVAGQDSEIKWFTTPKMRKNTAEWAGWCGESGCNKPVFAGNAQPVAKKAAYIETHTGWLATTDYRAFVWSYAYTQGSLRDAFGGAKDRPERYGHWVKFMNIDAAGDYWTGLAAKVGANAKGVSAFEQDWARKRTYARWAHGGTYYGISPHAGAMLTDYEYDDPPFNRHFATMYFDQTLLLLYLRVMAFQLSIRMAKLSAEVGDSLAEHMDKDCRANIIRLRREDFKQIRQLFMSFVSLYQFPLLSTQQQSVEMYTLFRRHMDIDELYRDVSAEIDTWDRVIAQHDQERSTDEVAKLTRVGVILTTFGLPFAFLTVLLAWVPAWDTVTRKIAAMPHPIYRILTIVTKAGSGWGIFLGAGALVVAGICFAISISLAIRIFEKKAKTALGTCKEKTACSCTTEER
jgi:hypothetical protein